MEVTCEPLIFFLHRQRRAWTPSTGFLWSHGASLAALRLAFKFPLTRALAFWPRGKDERPPLTPLACLEDCKEASGKVRVQNKHVTRGKLKRKMSSGKLN